jgi:hypothetical protein
LRPLIAGEKVEVVIGLFHIVALALVRGMRALDRNTEKIIVEFLRRLFRGRRKLGLLQRAGGAGFAFFGGGFGHGDLLSVYVCVIAGLDPAAFLSPPLVGEVQSK